MINMICVQEMEYFSDKLNSEYRNMKMYSVHVTDDLINLVSTRLSSRF